MSKSAIVLRNFNFPKNLQILSHRGFAGHQYKSGFTLIELLVVIAIIGILSAVVLSSLNSARAKGANAAVKSDLANMRAQAELYYDNQNPNGYGTSLTAATCPISGTTMFYADLQIRSAIAHAASAGGGGTAGTRCATNGSNYAISVQLKVAESGNSYWCIDSTGVAKGINVNNWTGVACP